MESREGAALSQAPVVPVIEPKHNEDRDAREASSGSTVITCEELLSRLPSDLRTEMRREFDYMDGFKGVYSDAEIDADKKKVWLITAQQHNQNRRDGIHQFNEKGGDELEFLMEKKAAQYHWLGDFVITKASKYADLTQKTDAVAEVMSDGKARRMALTIDCTIDSNTSPEGRLAHKLKLNFNNIVSRKRDVKYFESQLDGKKGSIYCVPVVIGLANHHVEELTDHRNDPDYMSKTPAQVVMLKEVKMQLGVYDHLLRTKGDVEANPEYRQRVIKEVGRLSGLVDTALTEKIAFLASQGVSEQKITEYMRRDPTYVAIENFVAMTKK